MCVRVCEHCIDEIRRSILSYWKAGFWVQNLSQVRYGGYLKMYVKRNYILNSLILLKTKQKLHKTKKLHNLYNSNRVFDQQ